MPLFSVVIPVYNRANLIKGTLDSVFAQTERDYEVIVVDDGSTDATADVVKSYGDRVRYIYQENAGPGAARNKGIQAAKGSYVAFLDSDDLWFPWTLSVYARAINEFNCPSILAGEESSICDYSSLLKMNPDEPVFRSYSDYLEAAGKGIYFSTNRVVIKKYSLDDIGGLTNHNINAEDHDLALRLGVFPVFVVIESPPVVAVRRHEGNVSSDLNKSYQGFQYILNREKSGQYPGGASRALERQYILSQHIRGFSFELARRGFFLESLNLYRNTFTWQIRNSRIKYLFGLPIIGLIHYVRSFVYKFSS